MKNECVFSNDRKYRYVLKHSWLDMFDTEEKSIVWIALNPSTADEDQLDPTLTRIRNFSSDNGFNSFYMLNLFAYRATNPKDMLSQVDPIGIDNDYWINKICHENSLVVCCWGVLGNHLNRKNNVLNLIKDCDLRYLELSKDGIPKHPLYLKSSCILKRFNNYEFQI